MTVPFITTLLTALLVLAASACVGWHQILIGPDRPNYPIEKPRVRAAMFAWTAGLLYRGVEMLCLLFAARPEYVTFGTLAAAALLFIAQACLLEGVLRKWLPARIHKRIQQLLDIASCGHSRTMRTARERSNAAVRPGAPQLNADPSPVGAALVALSLQGVIVAGPNEPPESLQLGLAP